MSHYSIPHLTTEEMLQKRFHHGATTKESYRRTSCTCNCRELKKEPHQMDFWKDSRKEWDHYMYKVEIDSVEYTYMCRCYLATLIAFC